MGRHSNPVAGTSRAVRGTTLVLIWLAGIAAGLFALLGAAARYTTCSSHATTLACRSSGTTLGAVLVVAVVAVVTTITVATHGRDRRWIAIAGAVGLLVLAGLFLASRALLSTV
ncbi:MAG: hypothetical protein ACRDWT_20530 [Jatrophihabitantaceae bacterium]